MPEKTRPFFAITTSVLFLQEFFEQADDLARFGVPPGLELGINQRIAHPDLEPAAL
jgi:hypothetical protein